MNTDRGSEDDWTDIDAARCGTVGFHSRAISNLRFQMERRKKLSTDPAGRDGWRRINTDAEGEEMADRVLGTLRGIPENSSGDGKKAQTEH